MALFHTKALQRSQLRRSTPLTAPLAAPAATAAANVPSDSGFASEKTWQNIVGLLGELVAVQMEHTRLSNELAAAKEFQTSQLEFNTDLDMTAFIHDLSESTQKSQERMQTRTAHLASYFMVATGNLDLTALETAQEQQKKAEAEVQAVREERKRMNKNLDDITAKYDEVASLYEGLQRQVDKFAERAGSVGLFGGAPTTYQRDAPFEGEGGRTNVPGRTAPRLQRYSLSRAPAPRGSETPGPSWGASGAATSWGGNDQDGFKSGAKTQYGRDDQNDTFMAPSSPVHQSAGGWGDPVLSNSVPAASVAKPSSDSWGAPAGQASVPQAAAAAFAWGAPESAPSQNTAPAPQPSSAAAPATQASEPFAWGAPDPTQAKSAFASGDPTPSSTAVEASGAAAEPAKTQTSASPWGEPTSSLPPATTPSVDAQATAVAQPTTNGWGAPTSSSAPRRALSIDTQSANTNQARPAANGWGDPTPSSALATDSSMAVDPAASSSKAAPTSSPWGEPERASSSTVTKTPSMDADASNDVPPAVAASSSWGAPTPSSAAAGAQRVNTEPAQDVPSKPATSSSAWGEPSRPSAATRAPSTGAEAARDSSGKPAASDFTWGAPASASAAARIPSVDTAPPPVASSSSWGVPATTSARDKTTSIDSDPTRGLLAKPTTTSSAWGDPAPSSNTARAVSRDGDPQDASSNAPASSSGWGEPRYDSGAGRRSSTDNEPRASSTRPAATSSGWGEPARSSAPSRASTVDNDPRNSGPKGSETDSLPWGSPSPAPGSSRSREPTRDSEPPSRSWSSRTPGRAAIEADSMKASSSSGPTRSADSSWAPGRSEARQDAPARSRTTSNGSGGGGRGWGDEPKQVEKATLPKSTAGWGWDAPATPAPRPSERPPPSEPVAPPTPRHDTYSSSSRPVPPRTPRHDNWGSGSQSIAPSITTHQASPSTSSRPDPPTGPRLHRSGQESQSYSARHESHRPRSTAPHSQAHEIHSNGDVEMSPPASPVKTLEQTNNRSSQRVNPSSTNRDVDHPMDNMQTDAPTLKSLQAPSRSTSRKSSNSDTSAPSSSLLITFDGMEGVSQKDAIIIFKQAKHYSNQRLTEGVQHMEHELRKLKGEVMAQLVAMRKGKEEKAAEGSAEIDSPNLSRKRPRTGSAEKEDGELSPETMLADAAVASPAAVTADATAPLAVAPAPQAVMPNFKDELTKTKESFSEKVQHVASELLKLKQHVDTRDVQSAAQEENIVQLMGDLQRHLGLLTSPEDLVGFLSPSLLPIVNQAVITYMAQHSNELRQRQDVLAARVEDIDSQLGEKIAGVETLFQVQIQPTMVSLYNHLLATEASEQRLETLQMSEPPTDPEAMQEVTVTIEPAEEAREVSEELECPPEAPSVLSAPEESAMSTD